MNLLNSMEGKKSCSFQNFCFEVIKIQNCNQRRMFMGGAGSKLKEVGLYGDKILKCLLNKFFSVLWEDKVIDRALKSPQKFSY